MIIAVLGTSALIMTDAGKDQEDASTAILSETSELRKIMVNPPMPFSGFIFTRNDLISARRKELWSINYN